MPSSDHNEFTKAHWAIRWEKIRNQLASNWGMRSIADESEYNLQRWQARQDLLFEQAQKESLQ